MKHATVSSRLVQHDARARRFLPSVPNPKRTLAQQRLALVQAVVKADLARWINEALGLVEHLRRCANCGRLFHPANRRHFICGPGCRREWNRGLFFPKKRGAR